MSRTVRIVRRRAPAWLLLGITSTLLALICIDFLQQFVSFDGAMNLQVSWSLAHGDGYRRTYADRPAFPQEVQSGAPLVLPAALVFRWFGVGIWQAQAANVLYLWLVCVPVFFLVRRRWGPTAGFCGVLAFLVTPGFLSFGAHGYGEIPGLFWLLLALVVFPWGSRTGMLRVFMAGLFLGLSICTKTIFALCVLVSLGCFALDLGRSPSRTPRRAKPWILLGVGLLLPFIVMETWKLMELGGISAYCEWWADQLGAVSKQAGLAPGYEDTSSRMEKIFVHVERLGGYYHLPASLLVVWIVGPILGLWTSRRQVDRIRDLPLFALLLSALLFFAWWLALTPTSKAWHRRILVGSLLLNVSWTYVAAFFWERLHGSRKWWRSLLAGAGVLVMFYFLRVDAGPALISGPTPSPDFERALEAVRRLPPQTSVFGLGWYSAPTLSLYAERPFRDFFGIAVIEWDPQEPLFVALDEPALAMRKDTWFSTAYRTRTLLPKGSTAQLLEVDISSARVEVPADEVSGVLTHVDLTSRDYEFLAGAYSHRPGRGRWFSTDGLIALRYEGQAELLIFMFAEDPHAYRKKDGTVVEVRLNECRLGTVSLKGRGLKKVSFPVLDSCRPPVGSVVTLRLLSSDFLDQPLIRDDRALSMQLLEVGFGTGEKRNVVDLDAAHSDSKEGRSVLLEVHPNPASFCSGERGSVEVSWDAEQMLLGGIQVWIEEEDGRRKLWFETSQLKGSKTTGPWASDEMQFLLIDPSRKSVLRTVELRARECFF